MEPVRHPATCMAGNSRAADRWTSATSSNESIASPKPDCAICLEKLQNECFVNSCLHQFCFSCLVKWSKVKPECPICKQSFKSIIHNVRSIEDYDEYHLQTEREKPNPWNSTVNLEILEYFLCSVNRHILARDDHLRIELEHPEHDLQRRVEPGDAIPTYPNQNQLKTEPSFQFRKNVYIEDLWVQSQPIIGRPRDISPQHFRQYPEEMLRMFPWLKRELCAIVKGPGSSLAALRVVLNLLRTHAIQSEEFRKGVQNILRDKCDHFIHELYSFAQSPYDMDDFDENAVYSCRITVTMDVEYEISSDSTDSAALTLPSEGTAASLRKGTSAVLPRFRSPVAGPSRAILPVDEPSASDANAGSSSESNITLPTGLQELARGSSSTEAESSDSDSCVFVDYVKPPHERTPEIISLSSDQEGDVKESSQMDTGLYDSRDSYVSCTVRKSQRKKVNRKRKCDGTAKCKAKTNCEGCSKTAPTSTKKRVKTKPEYSSSDSDSSVSSRNGRRSFRRLKAPSSSNCSSASGCSSSSKPTYVSRKLYSSRTGQSNRRSSYNDKGHGT